MCCRCVCTILHRVWCTYALTTTWHPFISANCIQFPTLWQDWCKRLSKRHIYCVTICSKLTRSTPRTFAAFTNSFNLYIIGSICCQSIQNKWFGYCISFIGGSPCFSILRILQLPWIFLITFCPGYGSTIVGNCICNNCGRRCARRFLFNPNIINSGIVIVACTAITECQACACRYGRNIFCLGIPRLRTGVRSSRNCLKFSSICNVRHITQGHITTGTSALFLMWEYQL